MTTFDEMALVHRFVRGEHPLHLAALFQVSLSTVYLLIHNGVWLFAILWGSLYCRHWEKRELDIICSPPSHHASYVPYKELSTVVVAGDCTESEIAAFDDLRLAKLVYSEKKEAPSLKIFTVTALNKFTLLHSAVYGGSATERAPAEAVIDSPDWPATVRACAGASGNARSRLRVRAESSTGARCAQERQQMAASISQQTDTRLLSEASCQ